MKSYNPADWYWYIGGNKSQAYSSARNEIVPSSDDEFKAFITAGGMPTNCSDLFICLGVVIEQTGVLDAADRTVLRICEAVALGLNSWTDTDVVAWMEYRRALRDILNGTNEAATSVPRKPAFPAGT